MRILVLATLLIASLAGCITTSESTSFSSSTTTKYHTWTESFGSLLVTSQDPPGQNTLEFAVPDGTTGLTVDPAWSCVSLCRLKIWLEGPDGTVAAEQDRGGGGNAFVIDAPAAGNWAFGWAAAEGASVGIEGEVEFTVYETT